MSYYEAELFRECIWSMDAKWLSLMLRKNSETGEPITIEQMDKILGVS